MRLLEETIDLPHLPERWLGPPFSSDDRRDLVPERLGVLGMCSEIVQSVGQGLK